MLNFFFLFYIVLQKNQSKTQILHFDYLLVGQLLQGGFIF